MSVVGKYAEAGNKVWVHYNTKSGQSQYGDYAYVQGYAKNRSQKVDDGVKLGPFWKESEADEWVDESHTKVPLYY